MEVLCSDHFGYDDSFTEQCTEQPSSSTSPPTFNINEGGWEEEPFPKRAIYDFDNADGDDEFDEEPGEPTLLEDVPA